MDIRVSEISSNRPDGTPLELEIWSAFIIKMNHLSLTEPNTTLKQTSEMWGKQQHHAGNLCLTQMRLPLKALVYRCHRARRRGARRKRPKLGAMLKRRAIIILPCRLSECGMWGPVRDKLLSLILMNAIFKNLIPDRRRYLRKTKFLSKNLIKVI